MVDHEHDVAKVERRLTALEERLDKVMEGNGTPGLRTIADDLYGDPRRGRVGIVELIRASHEENKRTAATSKQNASVLRLVLAIVTVLLASQVPILADILRLGVGR